MSKNRARIKQACGSLPLRWGRNAAAAAGGRGVGGGPGHPPVLKRRCG
ncbi:MAG: hypothetical protein MPW13_14700 [Candidatus Manganitrophus sp.]|nr:hypothetical protein [Candidatus Manganitrophus sp.]